MSNTITTLEYAPVQDGNGVNLGGGYSVTSSDPSVASIGEGAGGSMARAPAPRRSRPPETRTARLRR